MRPGSLVPSFLFLLIGCSATPPGTGTPIGVPDSGLPAACDGVDCSGHGRCAVLQQAMAVCVCDAGFRAEGTTCVTVVAGQECSAVTCSGHGQCAVLQGPPAAPVCRCEAGYQELGGTTCVPIANPCAGVTCGGNGACAVRGVDAVCVCNPGFSLTGQTNCVATAGSPCEGITCSGRGQCAVAGTEARCLCNPGFVAMGTSCDVAPSNPCTGVTCSGQGVCGVTAANQPVCSCNPGFVAQGTACVAVPTDGGAEVCSGITCSSRGQCAVLGGTTPTCVCSAGYVPNGLACVLQGQVGGDLTLLAGALGGSGSVDGPVGTSRFNRPQRVGLDAAGNAYVAGQSLRRISSAGVTTTLAGLDGVGNAGNLNGAGPVARFTNAQYPVVDAAGNTFVYDLGSIRRISPTGTVTTFAGSSAGMGGNVDGPGTSARFTFVRALAIDAAGTLYATSFRTVTASSINVLRIITPAGVVSTVDLAGPLGFPNGLAVSADGATAWVLDTSSVAPKIVTVNTATGASTVLASLPVSGAASYVGLCREGANLYVSDSGNQRISKLPTTGGALTLVAGSTGAPATDPVSVDGPGVSARFAAPAGLGCGVGKVAVADTGNSLIRLIDVSSASNTVTTLGGTPLVQGAVDGTGPAARFRFASQVVADSQGNWYVADTGNAAIRKVTPAGVVTTFAGSLGTPGTADGTGTAARFSAPRCSTGGGCFGLGLAIGPGDFLYVADRGNRALRRISPAGVVTTLASGDPVTTASNFAIFSTLGVDSNADVYFTSDDGVRRWSAAGSTITTVIVHTVNRPNAWSVTVDATRRKLFFVQGNGSLLRYDLSSGTPVLESTIAVMPNDMMDPPFPGQLAVAPNGTLAISYPSYGTIQRFSLNARSDTIAGEAGAFGVELGPLPGRLNSPTGVAFNPAGQFAITMGRSGDRFGSIGSNGEGALLVTTGFLP